MSTLTDYVSADESLRVRWEGTLLDGARGDEVVVGTTERCLVFCSERGRFGVVPRDHVGAVESTIRTTVEYDLEDYRLLVGGGTALAAGTFLAGILAASGLASLLFLLVTGAGLWLAEHGWRNREDYDGLDRRKREVEYVVVHTDDGARRTFRFPAADRAGAGLSRFVRRG